MIKLRFLVIIFVAAFLGSCDTNDGDKGKIQVATDFSWKEEVKISDIPGFPLKGYMNGKEITFEYINFEQWRGSGDNVFNFGNKIPRQSCGYVEHDDAFQLLRKGGDFQEGELIKENFSKNIDGFLASFHYFDGENDIISERPEWNVALVIEEMTENRVTGRIALCFNDEFKSWIAGKFEALRCYN